MTLETGRDIVRGILILFDPATPWGLAGLQVLESADRTSLEIAIEAPCVRARMYRGLDSAAATEDRGAPAGDLRGHITSPIG